MGHSEQEDVGKNDGKPREAMDEQHDQMVMFSFDQLGLENDSPVKKGPQRARIIPKKTQTQKVKYELQQNQVVPGGVEGQDTEMNSNQALSRTRDSRVMEELKEGFRNVMDDEYL